MNSVASSGHRLENKVRSLMQEVARLNASASPGEEPRSKSIWIGPTSEVADFFRKRARGLSPEAFVGKPSTWAPTATRSMAPIAFDGWFGKVPRQQMEVTSDPTFPENQYCWYDLEAVEPGGYVFRFDSERKLQIFRRMSAGLWIGKVIKRVPPDIATAAVAHIVKQQLSS